MTENRVPASSRDAGSRRATGPFLTPLRAQPWWDVAAWWHDMENTPIDWSGTAAAIAGEFLALAAQESALEPYLRPDEPGVDTATIGGWQSAFLMRNGIWRSTVARRCPQTTALIDRLPWFPGDIMFSVLAPGVAIPAHFGLDNLHLTFHLPLIVPTGCELVVRGQARTPAPGVPLLFDDTYLHRSANPGGDYRVHLLADVFHPELRAEEVRVLRALWPTLTRIRVMNPPGSR